MCSDVDEEEPLLTGSDDEVMSVSTDITLKERLLGEDNEDE